MKKQSEKLGMPLADYVAINIANGMMNIMTASQLQPETAEENKTMMNLLKEGTKCFRKAIVPFIHESNILTPERKMFINNINNR